MPVYYVFFIDTAVVFFSPLFFLIFYLGFQVVFLQG